MSRNRKNGYKRFTEDKPSGIDGTPSQVERTPSLPTGMGLQVPRIKRATTGDEETYLPLAILYGYYQPMGNLQGQFVDLGTNWCRNVLSKLDQLGYTNQYTTGQIITYMSGVAQIIQFHHFIKEMKQLADMSALNVDIPVQSAASFLVNGSSMAMMKRLDNILKSLPYPPKFYEAFIEGFSMSRTSDNVGSPLRMFSHVSLAPAGGASFNGVTFFSTVDTFLDTFFADTNNVQLSNVLPFPTVAVKDYGDIASVPYRPDTIANVMNQSFYDAVTYEPQVNEETTRPIFYNKEVSAYGLQTVATSDNLGVSVYGTTWFPQVGATAYVVQYFDNGGLAQDSFTNSQTFASTGLIWESSLGLEAGVSMFTSRANAPTSNIEYGLADLLFAD